MIEQRKRARRTVRYTLLLFPSELQLAKKRAAREFRTLPDFFRAHIYQAAQGQKRSATRIRRSTQVDAAQLRTGENSNG